MFRRLSHCFSERRSKLCPELLEMQELKYPDCFYLIDLPADSRLAIPQMLIHTFRKTNLNTVSMDKVLTILIKQFTIYQNEEMLLIEIR